MLLCSPIWFESEKNLTHRKKKTFKPKGGNHNDYINSSIELDFIAQFHAHKSVGCHLFIYCYIQSDSFQRPRIAGYARRFECSDINKTNRMQLNRVQITAAKLIEGLWYQKNHDHTQTSIQKVPSMINSKVISIRCTSKNSLLSDQLWLSASHNTDVTRRQQWRWMIWLIRRSMTCWNWWETSSKLFLLQKRVYLFIHFNSDSKVDN